MLSIEGGTLNGSGTIDTRTDGGASTGIVANFNGTVAPGSPTSTGTLTIVGDYFQGPGGILLIKIAGNDADKLAVIGNAALNGTVQAMFGTGSYLARTRTILSATDGLDGTFSNLTTSNLPASFTANLSYTNTDVLLNLTASLGAGGGLSGNQQNVTNALNSFFNNGGALPPAFVTIFGLGGGNLANALGQLSGEAATGGQQATFNAMTAFLGILTDPSIDGRGGAAGGAGATPFAEDDLRWPMPRRRASARVRSATPMSMITKAPRREGLRSALERLGFWLRRLADHRRQCGNRLERRHQPHLRHRGRRGLLLSPRTIAGFAFAGGGTNLVIANSRLRAFRPVPGRRFRPPQCRCGLYLRRAGLWLAGCHHRPYDHRSPASISLQARVQRQRLVRTARRRLSLCHAVDERDRHHTLAAGQFTTFDLPAYAEQALSGSNTFALAYGSKERERPRARNSAFEPTNPWRCRTAILTLRSRLGWAHDYNPDRGIAAAFQTLPGASFVVNGAAQAHRLGADHRLRRDEMDKRLVGRRHLRGRVLQRHHELRRQGPL